MNSSTEIVLAESQPKSKIIELAPVGTGNTARSTEHPELCLDLTKVEGRNLTLACFYDYANDKELGMGEPLVLTASDMAFRQEKNRRKLAVKAVNHLIAEIQECATSYVRATFVEFSAQRWAEYELTRNDVQLETTKLMEALGFRVKFFAMKAEVVW